ncbi:hypothetical protein ATL51_3517 [Pseudonocardia alni]|uniref:Uncharacterized protein n=1 Tax=Pseudonocardia alni TaxID=33907 RepID=A0AA44URE6_PSEA5|nr:hypothetical protein ATL51_3517 [Pseudonocardia alni]
MRTTSPSASTGTRSGDGGDRRREWRKRGDSNPRSFRTPAFEATGMPPRRPDLAGQESVVVQRCLAILRRVAVTVVVSPRRYGDIPVLFCRDGMDPSHSMAGVRSIDRMLSARRFEGRDARGHHSAVLREARGRPRLAPGEGSQRGGCSRPGRDQSEDQDENVDCTVTELILERFHLGAIGLSLSGGRIRAFQIRPRRQAEDRRVDQQMVEQAAGVAGKIVWSEAHGFGQFDEPLRDNPIEELLLGAEVDVDRPLVRAGPVGDAVDPRSGQAVLRELRSCGGQDPTLGLGRIWRHLHSLLTGVGN